MLYSFKVFNSLMATDKKHPHCYPAQKLNPIMQNNLTKHTDPNNSAPTQKHSVIVLNKITTTYFLKSLHFSYFTPPHFVPLATTSYPRRNKRPTSFRLCRYEYQTDEIRIRFKV